MNSIWTSGSPLVTVVVPVFNDEETIAAALDSALAQTLAEIEIVVVDDASTDRTADIVSEYAARDGRLRLVRQIENMSGFQARRAGILAARAPYVLFLDGDDELDPRAAAAGAAAAMAHQADLVQFGIHIIYPDGASGGSWEARSQPEHTELVGEDILVKLFPVGAPVAGQLWKYLFRTDLLRSAYASVPANARHYRANDLPIAFLTAALAQHYVSIPEKLYRYYWRRGASATQASGTEAIDFQIGAIDAFDSISEPVRELAYRHSYPQALIDSHSSARDAITAIAMKWALDTTDLELFRYAVDRIEQRVGKVAMVRAAARYQPAVLEWLAERDRPVLLGAGRAQSVLITTANLTTGGVSMVVRTQAKLLAESGHRVTIVARRRGNDTDLVPEGVAFYEVVEGDRAEMVSSWGDICVREEVDVVIDHRILYSKDWHVFVVAAAALKIPTIGWVHNFAGRPTYDLSDMHGYLRRCLPALAQVVTLSPLDVSFWKLRGIDRTAYLPNPPSPLLLEHSGEVEHKSAPSARIELIWLGRMEQHTKQVQALIPIATELRKLDVDFRLRVIGPDQKDFTAARFNVMAAKAGLADRVEAVGPLHDADLLAAIDSAHAFVGTSIIEGYQLTIVEAQSRGLPVFMYEMAWLVPVQQNQGVVAVPQGDSRALAQRIAEVAADPRAYETLSRASLVAARRTLNLDFGTLYAQLIDGKLPALYSPQPNLEDAGELLDLFVGFAERHAGIRKELQHARRGARPASKQAQSTDSGLRGAGQLISAKTEPSRGVEVGNVTTRSLPGIGLYRRARRKLRRLRAQFERPPRALCVTGGEMRDDVLILTLRAPMDDNVVGVELLREVDGVVTTFPLAVTGSKSRFTASRGALELDHRRWRVRATVQSSAGKVEVGVPIRPSATRTGGGPLKVRFHDGESLQVYRP